MGADYGIMPSSRNPKRRPIRGCAGQGLAIWISVARIVYRRDLIGSFARPIYGAFFGRHATIYSAYLTPDMARKREARKEDGLVML